MLTGSITPKTYRLLNELVAALPELDNSQNKGGLERAKLVLEHNKYDAIGIWESYGSVISIRKIDGTLSTLERDWVAGDILEVLAGDREARTSAGYFMIHTYSDPGDEEYEIEPDRYVDQYHLVRD